MLKIISDSHVKHCLQNRTTQLLQFISSSIPLSSMYFFSTLSSSSFLNSKSKKEKTLLTKQKCSSNCSSSTGMLMYIALFYFVFYKEINSFLIIWTLSLLHFFIFLWLSFLFIFNMRLWVKGLKLSLLFFDYNMYFSLITITIEHRLNLEHKLYNLEKYQIV